MPVTVGEAAKMFGAAPYFNEERLATAYSIIQQVNDEAQAETGDKLGITSADNERMIADTKRIISIMAEDEKTSTLYIGALVANILAVTMWGADSYVQLEALIRAMQHAGSTAVVAMAALQAEGKMIPSTIDPEVFK